MEEKEVIKNLKEHILYCIKDHGRFTKHDRGYCISYIMDFVFYDSADTEKEMTKKAQDFLQEKILKRMDIPSEKFEGVNYIVVKDCVVIQSTEGQVLTVMKNNIAEFIKELKGIGEAI